jgi:hypothetical protein
MNAETLKAMKPNTWLKVLALASLAGWSSPTQGAEAEPPGEGQRPSPWRQRLQEWRAQGQGNRNAEELRARLGDRLRTMLRATDEEWSIIQPLVEDVVAKQGAAMRGQLGGLMGAWGMTSGRGGGVASAPPPDSPSSQRPGGSAEALALRQVVESDSATVAEIKAKLSDYRGVRKKAQAELQDARERLRAVLTHRQEAQLVLLGILD